MARLRDPDGGCPWDLEQDFSSIAPYTVEEAYEVADAIDRGDMDGLREELGDLLLQVVFHSRMAQEAGHFGFGGVVAAISDKMVSRHPHVFAGAEVADPASQTREWEEHKRRERQARGETGESALAGVSRGMPEWMRAVKLQDRAARTGFDWPGPAPVLDKLLEGIEEVRVELEAVAAAPGDATARGRLEEEIGDLLFVAANLARHARVDVGTALRRANLKFERRFRAMEALARAEGTSLRDLPLQAHEAYWARVKQQEGKVQ